MKSHDSRPLVLAIVTCFIVTLIAYANKPIVMYTLEGHHREFGVSNNETITPLWLVIIVAALFVYLFASIRCALSCG